jgi:hypothetical protein
VRLEARIGGDEMDEKLPNSFVFAADELDISSSIRSQLGFSVSGLLILQAATKKV